MDNILRQNHKKKVEQFENDIKKEFEQVKNEMDSIQIDVEPNDVEITSDDRGYWEHDITNRSPFALVCRVRATSSYLLTVSKNVFLLEANDTFMLKVLRAAHPIRSHHLKFDVVKYCATFHPINLHDYFSGPYPYKTFVVRYHGAPRYWSDALELNDWFMNHDDLKEMMDEEMKKTSKEKKSSQQDETDKPAREQESSDSEYEEAMDEIPDGNTANVNLTNVFLMAVQDVDGDKKSSGSDSDEKDDEAAAPDPNEFDGWGESLNG
ncbi:unnamed protein product [Caenorhabditis sp. 36 PRJEB53466]|nr:unnamed protein product [Caenorhabditis sp. 36 PRJEB53466]